MVNVLAYADDLVLCAPSWYALQQLLNLLSVHIDTIDMTCNLQKTACMIFDPLESRKIVFKQFPPFQINNTDLAFVQKFKYLGHILCRNLSDDSDIMREVKNMFYRTNVLIRKFAKCSLHVKLTLFRA